MAVYNDEINARLNFLVSGGSTLDTVVNKAISGMQRLEAQASKTARQIKMALSQEANSAQGVFGKIFSPDLAQKNTAEANKMPGSNAALDADYDAVMGIKKAISAQDILNSVTDETIKKFELLEKQEAINAQMTALHTKQMRKMGAMFGLLFGGMQLQRFSDSIVRFVLPAMDKLENYQSRGVKQINALNASWEFFKFQMFEALTQTPLFQNFVELLIKAANWMADMVGNHGGLVATLATIGLIGSAISRIAITAGFFIQMSMLTDSMKVLALQAKLANRDLAGVNKGLSGLQKATIAGGIILSVASIIELVNADRLADKIGYGLSAALGVAGALTAIWNPGLGLALTITGGITYLITKFNSKILDKSDAIKGILGQDALNPENLNAKYTVGQNAELKETEAIAAANYKAFSLYSEIYGIKRDLSLVDSKDADSKIKLNNQLSSLNTEYKTLVDNYATLDKTAYDTIAAIEYEIDARNEAKSALEESSKKEQQANSAIQEGYKLNVLEIGKSKEETANFTTNLQSMIDLIAGQSFVDMITNLQMIEAAFNDADIKFISLKDNLDKWASTELTKTVKIKYVEEGKNSGNSFLGEIKSTIGRIFSNADSSKN